MGHLFCPNIFVIEVINNVSCNFFYGGNNFLSLLLIDFAILCVFDAVSKVVITALSQKNFESNLGIPESQELFSGLLVVISKRECLQIAGAQYLLFWPSYINFKFKRKKHFFSLKYFFCKKMSIIQSIFKIRL